MFSSLVVRPLAITLRVFLLTAVCIGSVLADETAKAEPTRFDIEQQSLKSALTEFARQSDREILYSTEVVADKEAPSVEGIYEPEDALVLLLADTGLDYSVTASETFLVNEGRGDRYSGNAKLAPMLTAQNQTNSPPATTSEERRDEESIASSDLALPLEEIVVTGTNIRGAENPASPVVIIGRQDIERSGFSNTADFVRSLPQNFSGPESTLAIGGVNGGSGFNTADGSSLNLRGLGSDSSLVLLNGRRLAAGGRGNFVDVSMIPLSAIERVEIVTDGSSAIYGSDAVGGVVNFVLRKDYEGAEARVRYGTSTSGGLDEVRAGLTIGKSWGRGSALIGYEFLDQDELNSADRDFSESAEDVFFLTPQQRRNSLILAGHLDISDRFSLSSDALYSLRDSFNQTVFAAPEQRGSDTEADQTNINVAADIEVTDKWSLRVAATAGETNTQRNVLRDGVISNVREFEIDGNIVTVTVDGSLFEAPGGEVRTAIGVEYRDDSYQNIDGETGELESEVDRNVSAVFAELLVPLFDESNALPWIDQLELSLAARYEDYSDFGDTLDPKVGLHWGVNDSVALRGTFGTSFRAPLLLELDDSNGTVLVLNLPDDTGVTTTLLRNGSNSKLQPETSENWTIGADLTPGQIDGLSISLTYYSIEFDGRIDAPGASNLFGFLNDPNLTFAVTRDPDLADVQVIVDAAPIFGNFSGLGLDSVTAIADARLANVTSLKTSGVDFLFDYERDVGSWNLTFQLNANAIIDLDRQVTPTSGIEDGLNTVFNPNDLHIRSGVTLSRGGLSLSAFLNYTDSYKDTRVEPVVDVNSYRTVDFRLAFSTSEQRSSGALSDLTLSLVASNLLDEDPPFVSTDRGINYDGTNADPFGRRVALELSKAW